jgi:futalosine hydrolase
MQLLLCAATEFEILPTIEFIRQEEIRNCTILVTGVGLPLATYHLTRHVIKNRPGLVIQAGVAGSLDKHLGLGSVVAVRSETIADLGVEENGRFVSLFEMGLLNREVFPWRNGRLENHLQVLEQTGLEIVDAVSVNEISTDGNRIDWYRNEFGASVESMEGAALHFVGLMENVPFLQLRSLSNFAGVRDKSKWVMKEAIVQLNHELQKNIIKILEL